MYFIGACSSPEDEPLDEDNDEAADWAPELTRTSEDCGEFYKVQIPVSEFSYPFVAEIKSYAKTPFNAFFKCRMTHLASDLGYVGFDLGAPLTFFKCRLQIEPSGLRPKLG